MNSDRSNRFNLYFLGIFGEMDFDMEKRCHASLQPRSTVL